MLCGYDLNEAISMYKAVAWHSSYPWATTQSTRRFGGSIVIMYHGYGHSFVGLLRAAVDAARTWGVGQRHLGMMRRLEHEMNRPKDYDCLLALCRSEIPKSEASDLLGAGTVTVETVGHLTARMLAVCTQTKQEFY